MQKRITLFLNHFPYPADHGAKVDIWRRIIVMHTLGYRLQIICWSGNTLSAENRQKVEAICDQLIIIPIYKSFWKRCKKAFLSLFFSLYPASISTHTDYKELKRIIRDFNPDILWLETFAPGLPALKMAKLLSIPLIYRSHNIEHHYAKEITDSIPNPQIRERVTRWFMSYQLENFEKKLIQKSQTVYDISI
jgi:UDP-N-acetylglucosamine:LPS N-acetylglucosamine transferase